MFSQIRASSGLHRIKPVFESVRPKYSLHADSNKVTLYNHDNKPHWKLLYGIGIFHNILFISTGWLAVNSLDDYLKDLEKRTLSTEKHNEMRNYLKGAIAVGNLFGLIIFGLVHHKAKFAIRELSVINKDSIQLVNSRLFGNTITTHPIHTLKLLDPIKNLKSKNTSNLLQFLKPEVVRLQSSKTVFELDRKGLFLNPAYLEKVISQ
ncbi:hypothetical protein HDV02_001793 [Globomyces sp. JEL0801]|nr:hypothetical protein HDV02_001793 [Globomyces sp. JEL0801]